MSYGTIIYLVAMLALFVGERLLVDNPLQGWVEGAARCSSPWRSPPA